MSSSPLTPEDRAKLEEIRKHLAALTSTSGPHFFERVAERFNETHDNCAWLIALIDRLTSTPVSPSGTWRAVTETEPPQGKYVLILIKGRAEAWIARRYNQWERPGEPWLDADRVEAWQPLPARPLPECSTPVSPPDGDLLGLCEEVLRLDGQATPDWHQGDTEEHEAGDADMVYTAEGDRLAGPFRREADARLIATYRSAAPRLARALRDRLMAPVASLGMDTPWPLWDVLAGLVDAADHLLKVHNCDCLGWEITAAARDAGRRMAAAPEPILQGEPRPGHSICMGCGRFAVHAHEPGCAEPGYGPEEDWHLVPMPPAPEAAQGEGAPPAAPAVDLWVEARRLARFLCLMIESRDGPPPALTSGVEAAHVALASGDPAAAERHLLAAQEAAGEADLLRAYLGPGRMFFEDSKLADAIDAALTAVRALPQGGQP